MAVCLVIDLQKLNAVTIRDTSLWPHVEDFAEGFVGQAIYGAADLFAGFDAQIVSFDSGTPSTMHLTDGLYKLNSRILIWYLLFTH